ncbi:MAG: hypothetical protein ACYTG4_06280, partial [Planctomycetota bacterium]|jgi:hypothetical protein
MDLDIELVGYTDDEGKYRFPSLPFGETMVEVETDDDWDDVEIEEENRENPLKRDFMLERD